MSKMKNLINQLFYFDETARAAHIVLGVISVLFMLVLGVGCVIIAKWIVGTRFGSKALDDSPARPNMLTPAPVFIVFLMWSFLILAISLCISTFFVKKPDKATLLGINIVSSIIGSIVTIVFCLFVGKKYFEDGLKGFGLTFNAKRLFREKLGGLGMFLAIWPLTIITYNAIYLLGTFVVGKDFEMPKHDYLASLSDSPPLWVMVAMFISAVYVAPVTEEMIFRGLFQTLLKRITHSKWPAIFFTSFLFAMIHGGGMMLHWPTLVVLSMGLGYAYEKTGSLVYPIVMHAAFNFVNISMAFLDSVWLT